MLTVLLQFLILLLIIGVILWGINYLPLDPFIQRLIRVVAVVAVVIYLIYLLTTLAGFPFVPPSRR
jgi:hypothetical protein